MRWEEHLLAVLDDLEQQAEGLALAERDALVAERGAAEYAAVDLASRLHGSVGLPLVVDVAGAGRVDGALVRAGDGWLLLAVAGTEWLVPLHAVHGVRGLPERATSADGRPLPARLSLASALRGIAELRAEVAVRRQDRALTAGLLGRVGADFVELLVGEEGTVEVLPLAALSAVLRR